MGNNIINPVLEAMTSDELADHQSAHYSLDDMIRRKLGRLTLEQKMKIHDTLCKMVSPEGGNSNG
jgi:hypothetical protein